MTNVDFFLSYEKCLFFCFSLYTHTQTLTNAYIYIFFPFITLNILHLSLLAYRISSEKSADSLTEVP